MDVMKILILPILLILILFLQGPATEGYNGNLFPFYGAGVVDPSGGVGPSGGCDSDYHPYDTNDCSACPTWTNPAGFFEEPQSGKWKNKYNSAIKKLEKAQKNLIRKESKLYDKYLDGLDGDQDGFWADLTSGIKTPTDKFAFDMKQPNRFGLSVKEAFMYLFNSGVRDFFVETEINIDYRDWVIKKKNVTMIV